MKDETVDVGTVPRAGPGDCSLAQRKTRAGVGSGDLWKCPAPLYRLVEVGEENPSLIVGHFFSGPVLCARRDIVSFQPLIQVSLLPG